MLSDRAWMAVRVVLWIPIGSYIVVVMRNPEIGDEVGRTSIEMLGIVPAAEAPWTALAAPAGLSLPLGASGGSADALLLTRSLDPSCPMPGLELRLLLGATGLRTVHTRGPVPPCAAAAVWSVAWPLLPEATELQTQL